jgi:hypothetical protein
MNNSRSRRLTRLTAPRKVIARNSIESIGITRSADAGLRRFAATVGA